MGKLREKYHFAESVVLSVLGLCVYNLVLQLFVYPTFDRVLGHETYGNALTAISVISVAAVSIGVGINYARMALRARVHTVNGDYTAALCIGGAVCALTGVFAGRFVGFTGATAYVLLAAMGAVLMLRYYSDVDFRLDVNYRKLLFFYLVLSAGYAIGTLLLRAGAHWQTVFLLAEALSVLFVVCFGSIYRKPFAVSENSGKALRSSVQLSLSQLFANFILHCDRILINFFMDGTAVTVFYTSSLLGKSIALLTGPFNGVILGFLAKSDKPITRRFFALCVAAASVCSALMFAALVPVTPFVIRFLYPDIAPSAAPYFLVANGSQIVYFITNLLLVIALRFMTERFQVAVNLGYTVLYLAVCIPCLMRGDLMRFMQCALAVNLLRFAVISVAGLCSAKGENT